MNKNAKTAPETGDDTPQESTDSSKTDETPGTTEKEIGGREGPNPTRFGDWEKNGRCIDF